MDVTQSKLFMTSLAKFLQTLCNDCVNFNEWVQVTGNLYVTIESGDIAQFVVNEKLNKQDQHNFSVTSNSLQELAKESVLSRQTNDVSLILNLNEIKKKENEDTKEEHTLRTISTHGSEASENHRLSPVHEENITKEILSVEIIPTGKKLSNIQDNAAPFGLSLDEQKALGIIPSLDPDIVKNEIAELGSDDVAGKITEKILNQLGLSCLVSLEKSSLSEFLPEEPKKTKRKYTKRKKIKKEKSGEYKCEVCNHIFPKKSSLLGHLNSHYGITPFMCEICGSSFCSKDSLKQHKKLVHSNSKSHECQYCGLVFNLKKTKEAHERSHTGEKPFACNLCPKAYKDRKSLKEHIRGHTGDRPYQCEQCGADFARKSALRRHAKSHKAESERAHKCTLCDRRFITASHLKDHFRSHTKEKPFTCEICGTSFSSSSGLHSHSRTHTGERPYKCDICDKTFKFLINMKEHKIKHTGLRPYSCDLCPKTFVSSKNLYNHKKSHSNLRAYKCTVCNLAFKLPATLKVHMAVHQTDRPFKCDICSKSFKMKRDLITHKNIHLGVQPYTCSHCGKKFTHHASYQIHLRRHSGEKPFKCQWCTKAFISSSRRLQHERTHTGEKPYTCDLCGKTFATNGNINQHKKHAHKIFPIYSRLKRVNEPEEITSKIEGPKTHPKGDGLSVKDVKINVQPINLGVSERVKPPLHMTWEESVEHPLNLGIVNRINAPINLGMVGRMGQQIEHEIDSNGRVNQHVEVVFKQEGFVTQLPEQTTTSYEIISLPMTNRHLF